MSFKISSSLVGSATRASGKEDTRDNLTGRVQKSISQDAAVTSVRVLNLSSLRSLKSDLQTGNTSISDAKRISKDIASELSSPYRTQEDSDETVEASSGRLDPERVASLLEE